MTASDRVPASTSSHPAPRGVTSARARASREKGARGEREVVAVLREEGWPNACRTSNGRAQEARGDIANGPPHTHIEVKRQERLNVPAAFQQIRRDARPLDAPVLVHRPSNEEWLVTIPLRDWLRLQRGVSR